MVRLFFPCSYGFCTRVKTFPYRISFLVLTVVPSLYIALYFGGARLNTFINYCVAFFAMYSLYEIGYIYNDIYTTSFEEHPTIRLTERMYTYVKKYYPRLIASRVVIVACSVIYIYYCEVNYIGYLLCLTVLYVGYSLHNSTRSKITAFTMFTIVWMKYLIPSLLFVPIEFIFEFLFLTIVMMPLPRFIEYGSKEYCSLFHLKDYKRFRLFYYGGVLLLEIALLFFTKRCVWHIPLVTFLLLYRCLTTLVEKKTSNYFRKQEEKLQCSE